MNRQEADVLRIILQKPFINQRILSEESGHSLGVVNRSVKSLITSGYLDKDYQLTSKAIKESCAKSPKPVPSSSSNMIDFMLVNLETWLSTNPLLRPRSM